MFYDVWIKFYGRGFSPPPPPPLSATTRSESPVLIGLSESSLSNENKNTAILIMVGSLHELDVKVCERYVSMVIATFLLYELSFQLSKDERFVEWRQLRLGLSQ